MNNQILAAKSIKELRQIGLTGDEIERIYRIQKVEYLVEDIQDRIDNYHPELSQAYDGMEDQLDAIVRRSAWEYVFDGIHNEGNSCEDEIELIISDIPKFPECDNLAEWVESNLDELDLFYDYLVGVESGNAVIRIAEGSGDNLDKEDRALGYIDYIDYGVYRTIKQLQEDENEDGGMVLLKEYYSDLTEQEIIERVLEEADVGTNYTTIKGKKIA